MVLDEWQELILRSALGERSDATWAAKRVGISVPRQNGKSQLLVARALAGALLFGERKIVISAHQQDTARESFGKMLELIEADENGWLRDRIRPNGIMQALNREAIRFSNGATIQFKARSGAGGRGFSSDCLMLDEAQILSQRAWVSINSTMSAMPNPQVWLLGTPPTPEDDGEVFASVRSSAMGGKSSATVWAEWAAAPDADPALEETRWSANPAWSTRINHEVVQGEFETYPPERFALDRLGIWQSDQSGRGAYDYGLWQSLADPDAQRGSSVAFGLDVDEARAASFAVAWEREDDGVQLMLADASLSPLRAPERANELASTWGGRVMLGGPSSALEDQIPGSALVSSADFAAGCGLLADLMADGSVHHGNQPELNEAVKAAKWRSVGASGDRAIQLRDAPAVGPLAAAVRALVGLRGNNDPALNVW